MRDNGYMMLVMPLPAAVMLYLMDPIQCAEFLVLISPIWLAGIAWVAWKVWTTIKRPKEQA